METFEEWLRAAPVGAVFKLADGTDKLRKLHKPQLVEYVLSVPELRERAHDSFMIEKRALEVYAAMDPWELRNTKIKWGLVD